MKRSEAAAPAPVGGAAPRAARRGRWAAVLAVLLLAAILLVRTSVATPVRVSSSSMVPTLGVGDVVLVDPGTPEPEDLTRGDLVTFRSPEDGKPALKRVVGLPGDELVIRDSVLYVNERTVPEPYVDHALIDGYYSRTYTVPSGSLFVLGDNRGNSIDSRDYGAVPVEDVLGRVLLRVWPLT